MVETIIKKAVHDSGQGDTENLAILIAFFVIYKLVEEVLRYRGIKNSKEKMQGYCKWVLDDHEWIKEIRDDIKSVKSSIKRIEKDLFKE